MALLVTRVGTKSWYITSKVNGRLIQNNLGEWPIVTPEATRKKAMACLQGNDPGDPSPERQAMPTLNDIFIYGEQAVWRGKRRPTDFCCPLTESV
ncbi:MAG: DUF4102 domain-containing protein [Planctomycetaceae bacterium]|nr:DUF4102 domain-containing protein [Planctomycetaceae bacterium]MBT6920073.1 DUF4102 domain-containing protein [Planctomycetaceae bacterium]